ncbi:MAG: hypothetical protein KIT57_11600 [Blastocatellales bacterium]|nr:hypothetical protein [Blastocatellales bacterium]
MASDKETNREQLLVEGLRYAVHGLDAPFACSGTFVPEHPVAIRFPDKTQIPVTRAQNTFDQEQLLRPLMARCKPAPFGKGRKTLYDRAIREARQLKAENGAFSVLHFDPAEAGILEQIRRELTPQLSDAPTAELYNLNIYETGGHFAPHKDTPRGSDMFGTLVVCLPSQFSNGAFVLRHRGVFQTYDWGDAIRKQAEPARIHWAAFFGDVDHQINRLWSGLRVTLTYLLRYAANVGSEAAAATAPLDSLVLQKLRELLGDPRFLPKGGTLAFPCSHMYHHDARFQRKQRPLSRQTASALKGRDHTVAAAALAEGLEVTLCPYMVETCVDETWRLEHFPTPRERAALRRRMDPWALEHALSVRDRSEDAQDFGVIWVDPPPRFNFTPTMYPVVRGDQTQAADPDSPVIAHLHSCEYSTTGYFGNEGSDIDLYVYGVLHVAIPPYGEGVRAATMTMPSGDAPKSSGKRGRRRS